MIGNQEVDVMNVMKRRGQSALEYLVTYGWAILAIVIVAAVVWYFGIFNPSKWSSSKQCGGFASFTCIDYSYAGTTVTAVLGNDVGRSVTITSPTSCTVAGVSSQIVGANQNANCPFSVGTANSGDQVGLNITYTDSRSGLSHNEMGFAKIP